MVRLHCYVVFCSLVASTIGVGCNAGKTETLNKSISPDGRWTAETIAANCGSMTCELVRVNVRPSSVKKASIENNIFVVRNLHQVAATWKDDTTLTVQCRDCVPPNIETKLESHGPIHVLYELP
jgi:hypothetical protein